MKTTTAPDTPAVSPPSRSCMTRNLRRRLWKAMQEGDVETAKRAYTATKIDYEQWIYEEEQERLREELLLQQEKAAAAKKNKHKHRGLGKLMGKLGGSTRHLNRSKSPTPSSSATVDHRPTSVRNFSPPRGAAGTPKNNTRRHTKKEEKQQQRRKSSKRWTVPSSSNSNNNHGLQCCVSPAENSSEESSSAPSSVFSLPAEEDLLLSAATATATAATNNNNNNGGVLQTLFLPTDAFESDDFYDPIQDDYDLEKLNEPLVVIVPNDNNNTATRESTTPRHGFRMPFFWGDASPHRAAAAAASLPQDSSLLPENEEEDNRNQHEVSANNNEYRTTPLHEAARLGNPDLMRIMLQVEKHGGDSRNGMQRSPLHMVAGGLDPAEKGFGLQQGGGSAGTKRRRQHNNKNDDQAAAVADEDNDGLGGIPTPQVPPTHATQKEASSNEAPVQRAARALTKLWMHPKRDDPATDSELVNNNNHKKLPFVSPSEYQEACDRRMNTLMLLLAQDDDAPSINAVDARGRTALHYAAELGRTYVCLMLLEQFGTILTLIDESGRTPCELASSQGHAKLACQLEARALLYMDPYGMDEDMMATMTRANAVGRSSRTTSAGRSGSCMLEPPFCYFETWKLSKQVASSREERIQVVLCQMKERLSAHQTEEELSDFILNYGNQEEEDAKKPCAAKTDKKEEGMDGDEDDKDGNDEKDTTDDEDDADKDENDDNEKENDDDAEEDAEERAEAAKESTTNKKPDPPATTTATTTTTTKQPGPYQHVIDGLHEAHAETYLISHSWFVDKAMEALEENAVVALTKAGIEIPHPSERPDTPIDTAQCPICFDEMAPSDAEWKVLEGCGHGFCATCLGDYIGECARTKESGLCISCPQHKCPMFMRQDEIQTLAPTIQVLESCLNAANENYVACAEDLAFCPHPACEGVVHRMLPESILSSKYDRDLVNYTGAVCTAVESSSSDEATKNKDDDNDENCPLTYEGVRDANYLATVGGTQPMQAHRFCFSCGEVKMHWPVPCDQLQQWKEKIAEEVGALGLEGEGGATQGESTVDDIAQQLWMKANTRPCPKCKAPIEKNDGCNHMTCTNRHCRHEFCWICRQDWKLHNTETGGFFRCNRWQGDEKHEFYDTPPPPEEVTTTSTADSDQNYGTAMHSSRVAFVKSKEMGRFLHHYRRWNAHAESAALERNMKESVTSRLAPVVQEAIEFSGTPDFDFTGRGLSFVHAAFTELLECRSVLQHSYAFCFFRYPTIATFVRRTTRILKQRERERLAFEQVQSELEMITEQMSDIVARRHLRASQIQIMFLTNSACEKRIHFQNLMWKLLQHQRKEKVVEEEEAKRKSKEKKQQQPLSSSAEPSPFDADSDMMSQQAMQHHQQHHPTRLRRMMGDYPAPSRIRPSRFHYRIDSDDDVVADLLGGLNDVDFGFNTATVSARMERAEEEAIQQALQASMASYQTESGGNNSDNNAADNQEEEDGPVEMWACASCTYMNTGRGRQCAVCGISR